MLCLLGVLWLVVLGVLFVIVGVWWCLFGCCVLVWLWDWFGLLRFLTGLLCLIVACGFVGDVCDCLLFVGCYCLLSGV